MSSKLPAIAISAMLLLSACRGTDSAPSAPDEFVKPLTARAAPSTPLAVTVEDQGPLSAYRIQSDGLGEYVHGVQTITAEIDGYGNLQFGPTFSTSLARTLSFDFSAPADPLNGLDPVRWTPGYGWNRG